MKLHHKVHLRRTSEPQPELSERYQAEVDQSVARAERAWRNAQRQVLKAEKRQKRQPSPSNLATLEVVRLEAERAWLRFQELDQLMRQGTSIGANRSGRGSVRRVGPAGSGD